MNKILFILLLSPFMAFSQSDDGKGNVAHIPAKVLGESNLAKNLKITSYEAGEGKYKKGKLIQSAQWFNYRDENGDTRRKRREYLDGYFMYDENLIAIPQTSAEEIRPTVQRIGKQIIVETEVQTGGNYYVYDGSTKIYDQGMLQATIFFDKGRLFKMNINHYYTNGQLQFVREITSGGIGQPLLNTGAQEAYYPDGSVFKNPLSEDGSAIIILNDTGEPEDECACMGQNIMEWGETYLYNFIGKYYYLLEHIYQEEEMDCCWE